jgi:chromate transporter
MKNPLIYLLIFLKASLFSSGGFSNLPSLHQDLLSNGWATEAEFGQALAIGQISPGPNGLWVISLGYLTDGYLGALLALIAITVPPLLVLMLAAIYQRIEKQAWVQGLMRGVSLAVVGLLLTVCWSIISRSGQDWKSWLIGSAAFGLAWGSRVPVIVILGLAALAGYLLYGLS